MQVDEQLRGGKDEVKDQGTAREGGAVEEGAQEPEERVDSKGEVEGGV